MGAKENEHNISEGSQPPLTFPGLGPGEDYMRMRLPQLSFEIYIMENVNYVQKERRQSNRPLCTYQLFSTSVNSRSFLQALPNFI